ncbi:MAG: hypothetical protein JW768_05765 [Chitinispirillaceae bacterium]|nr:hypothetical protein [Chitinispirillaceae bacterium]
MMRYVLVFLLGALLSGAGVYTFISYRATSSAALFKTNEQAVMKESVEKRMHELHRDIGARLAAFSREVATDQVFSLRLLAEKNPSAQEVTGKAVQFLKPMGFSLLDIVDSSYTILSSAEFTASAGNSMAEKALQLSESPVVIVDRVMGKEVITLQARHRFTIAESIPFHVCGGIIIDEEWLAGLAPHYGIRVLLKKGSTVMGMEGIRTISEITDGTIIINDKKYAAVSIPLPYAGDDEAPVLIALLLANDR